MPTNINAPQHSIHLFVEEGLCECGEVGPTYAVSNRAGARCTHIGICAVCAKECITTHTSY